MRKATIRFAYSKPLWIKLALCYVCLFCLAACGTLDSSGVYGGDQFLYQADMTVSTAYTALDAFENFELANRAILFSKNPAIKHEADKIRAGSPQWFGSYFALRAAYVSSKSAANKTALTQALSLIQAVLAESSTYLTP